MFGADMSSAVKLHLLENNKMKVDLLELPKGVYVFRANNQSLSLRKL